MVEYIVKKEICGTFHAKCGTRDLTCFRDWPAKGGMGGHPSPVLLIATPDWQYIIAYSQLGLVVYGRTDVL
jgi:hypothetical protein